MLYDNVCLCNNVVICIHSCFGFQLIAKFSFTLTIMSHLMHVHYSIMYVFIGLILWLFAQCYVFQC